MADTPYTQVGDYIPRRDSGFLDWGANFLMIVGQDPESWGITPGQFAMLQSRQQRYEQYYTTCSSNATRTTGTVRGKNDQRRELEALYRMHAQRIKKREGVSWMQLSELGIHIDDPTRTRIGAPRSVPVLAPMQRPTGGHVVRYTDECRQTSRSKPHGAVCLQLFAAVGPEMTVHTRNALFIGSFTRNPIRIDWDTRDAGKYASYFACWQNRRGQTGPYSAAKSLIITGGASATNRGNTTFASTADRQPTPQPDG